MTNMVTLPRKMLPIRLQIMKRLLLAGNPSITTPATAIASPPTVSAFVDAPAPPSIAPPAYPPTLPQGGATTTTAPPKEQEEEEATLEDDLATRRRKRGLRPGQLDVSTTVINRRKKELADRRAYVRNFWYAAGTYV